MPLEHVVSALLLTSPQMLCEPVAVLVNVNPDSLAARCAPIVALVIASPDSLAGDNSLQDSGTTSSEHRADLESGSLAEYNSLQAFTFGPV